MPAADLSHTVLRLIVGLAAVVAIPTKAEPGPRAAAAALGEADLPAILARIVPPVFPDRDFLAASYGAVADGTTDCTEAIRRAIDACHEAGGGRVVVAAGTYRTGPIHLRSGVNLHLAAGATLVFDPDPTRYPRVLTRFEGVECMNHSPLIYAFEQENIAVTGLGVLDGSASFDTWWDWINTRRGPPFKQAAEAAKLNAMAERGVPVGERRPEFLRPSFIEPNRCHNVLIEGITLRRSPMWNLHPVLCTNVTIRRVTVDSHGPNNDGCDPESCRDVLVEDCTFDTGDDCIAIKSGRNADGRRVGVPAENIVIRGCTMRDGHGGVTIGSEISGHCRNVFVEHCAFDSPQLGSALRIKNNAARGGVVENVFMRDVTVARVAGAVLSVEFLYGEGTAGGFRPELRHVRLDRVTSATTPRVLRIIGFDRAVIDDIAVTNSTFKQVSLPDMVAHAGSIRFEHVSIEPTTPAKARPGARSVH